MHLSKHPERSGSVILQQAWSMKLKDRLNWGDSSFLSTDNASKGGFTGSGNGGKSPKASDPCRKFNCGHCKYGQKCHFEHRCSYCFKFWHTVLTCRNLMADMEKTKNRKTIRKGNLSID